jgi:uncharacterized protein (DUF58 family)
VEPAALEAAIAELEQRVLDRLARAAGPALVAPPRLLPGARGRHRPTAAGVEFEELRSYVRGDDVRMVDWRASARVSHPQVRRFRDERAADWHLVLDCSSSMVNPSPGKWLRAAQVCLALGYLALRRGDRAALVLVGDRVAGLCPAGRGAGHYPALIGTLRRHAMVAPPGGIRSRPAAALAVIHTPATVVLVSDMLRADGLRPDLARLATAADHLRIIQVLDDQEVSLPASATPWLLVDAEDGSHRVAGDPAAARRNLAVYNRELAGWCRGRGVAYSGHSAAESCSRIVLGHLGMPASGHA